MPSLSPELRTEQEPNFDIGIPGAENLLRHFYERNVRISPEQFRTLIGEVEVTDLSTHPLAEQIKLPPLAIVEARKLLLDNRFANLSEAKKAHVLSHELGHRLYHRPELHYTNQIAKLKELTAQIPDNQVSYYLGHLSQVYDEQMSWALEEERAAELFAQYLESDGTFAGFMHAKLLEFPPDGEQVNQEQRELFEQHLAEVGSLQEYLDIVDNEQERGAFMAHHPHLQPHYLVWQHLHETFAELELSSDSVSTEPDDYIFPEDDELIFNFHEEWTRDINANAPPRTMFPALPQLQGAPKEQNHSLADFITFWKVFAN